MRISLTAPFMATFAESSWAFDALRYTSIHSYPVSRGKTGIAQARRAAKKRRNVKRGKS